VCRSRLESMGPTENDAPKSRGAARETKRTRRRSKWGAEGDYLRGSNQGDQQRTKSAIKVQDVRVGYPQDPKPGK